MSGVTEITCRSAANHINSRFLPYSWDLNIYRGCNHGCRYCYALYSHEYMGVPSGKNFYKDIYVKKNIVEQLEKQLSSPSWKRDVINVGGVCDSYQAIEKDYRIMPEVLRLLIKYRTPCIISTKADLILRDYDLITELAEVASCNIACTVTAWDENIRKKLEPGGASSSRRMEVLKAFTGTPVTRGVHLMPIIPYLTATHENLESIYSAARDADATYVLPGFLNLKGATRGSFFDFISREYPWLMEPLGHCYSSNRNMKEWGKYKGNVYRYIGELARAYGFNRSYMDVPAVKKSNKKASSPKEEEVIEQLSIFDS